MRAPVKFTGVLSAPSDDIRLRILNLLLERKCCVCEIEWVPDITESTASKEISKHYVIWISLRKDGLRRGHVIKLTRFGIVSK